MMALHQINRTVFSLGWVQVRQGSSSPLPTLYITQRDTLSLPALHTLSEAGLS